MPENNLLSQRRANPSCDHYMFISYSHNDSNIVYNDLSFLYENHVNFWYDKELNADHRLGISELQGNHRPQRRDTPGSV